MRAEPVRSAVLGAILIALTVSPLCFQIEPPLEKLQSPDYEDTLDTTSPIILSTSPAHGQAVYPNVDILIQFNESMNTSSFSCEFVLGWDPGMTWTWGSTVYENDTVRGTHGDLFSSPTEYAFNVTYAEDVAGNPLAPGPVPNPWNWSTIVVIVSSDPADGERKIDVYRDIIVNFSGPVDLTSNITWMIFPDPGGWTLTWLAGDTVFVLVHSNPFDPCMWYTVGIYEDGSPFPSLVPNPWWFETKCPPRVIDTDPEHGETDVPLDHDIRVWFSDPMDTATVLFTIDPGLPVNVSWSGNDTLLTISHTVLFLECQIYTVQIVAGQTKDGLEIVPGPGSVPNPWFFSTVCPPRITETNPPEGGMVNRPDLPINVTFSEPMNKATVNWTIIPYMDLTPSWSQNDTHLTLSHTDDFMEMMVYTVHITEGEDVDGNGLVPGPVPNPWTFSTTCWGSYIILTDPYDQETNVSTSRSVSVLFNSCMNPSSLTWDINPFIELSPYWSNSNTLLEFTHSAEFEGDTVYTMSVYVENEYGYPLQPGFVPNPWSWTTGTGLPPPPPPAPPRNITAYLSGPQLQDVTIGWELSDDDPSGNVSRYDIYRGVDSYDGSGSGYAHLASVPDGVSTYADQMVGTDAHSYYYFVCAANANGSSCTENQAGKFTRALEAGPQLVSIPLIPLDASVESVLQTLNFDIVWYFDSLDQSWKSYSKWKSYSRQLKEILTTMGVWVNVTEASNLTVAGTVPVQTAIYLYKGWNLVSFPSFNSSYRVSNLMTETGATRVEGYDPGSPYRLRVLQPTDVLRAGQAYWVRVDADVDWVVEVS